MTLPNQNIIYCTAFNFKYGNKASASRCNILIESIFNSHILPELEKAISKHIPDGLHVELSKLEIDIGQINEKEIPAFLAERIGAALENALQYNKINIMTNAEDSIPAIEEGDQVRVSNSGLILFWPFLTRLFEIHNFIKNGAFVNPENRNRAVYLLQQLVYNEINFPEHKLVLNKLLVGIPEGEHLVPIEALNDDEIESTKSLMNGLISNWDKVKNSTPEGIQETFLRRDGILKFNIDQVVLTVEKKGVDVLMQSIPWSISVVKLAWMEKPVYIEWL